MLSDVTSYLGIKRFLQGAAIILAITSGSNKTTQVAAPPLSPAIGFEIPLEEG